MNNRYVCRYCGLKTSNSAAAGNTCGRSPTGHHGIIFDQGLYVCRHCGYKSPNATLAGSTCSRSPTKRHELLDA